MKIYKHSLIAVAFLAQGTVGMASQSKDHAVDPETLSEPNHKDSGAPQGKPRTTLNNRQLKAIKGIGASATGYYLRSLRGAEKVDVCHKDENGIYKKITIADAAYDKHVAHGDGKVGPTFPFTDPPSADNDVPDMLGYAFDDHCDTQCKKKCLTSQPDAGCDMVGCGSCTALDSCVGSSGTIGDGSCTGLDSCFFASGTIGDGSCLGPVSCIRATATIGHGSCIADYSCAGASSATIGDGSCLGDYSCLSATGTIGHGSCNEERICLGCTADVLDNQCNGGDSYCPCE